MAIFSLHYQEDNRQLEIFLWSSTKLSQVKFKEMYGNEYGESLFDIVSFGQFLFTSQTLVAALLARFSSLIRMLCYLVDL